MIINFFLGGFFFLCFGICAVLANDNLNNGNELIIDKPKKLKAQIFIGSGLSMGVSATEFFEEYAKSFEGSANTLKDVPVGSAGIRVELGNDLRLSVMGSYLRSFFNDGYKIEAKTPIGSGMRVFDQDFVVETIPIIASLEYLSLRAPYRSYIGAGLGISVSRIYWQENIASSIDRDKRKGGINLNEKSVFPTMRISTGSELYFDRDFEDYFLGSLTLEVSYTYIFRSVDVFKNVREQFWEFTAGLNEKYSIAPGYIGMNLILSFNLPRDKQ